MLNVPRLLTSTFFAFLLAAALNLFSVFESGYLSWAIGILVTAVVWTSLADKHSDLAGWAGIGVALGLGVLAFVLGARNWSDQLHDLVVILAMGIIAGMIAMMVVSVFGPRRRLAT